MPVRPEATRGSTTPDPPPSLPRRPWADVHDRAASLPPAPRPTTYGGPPPANEWRLLVIRAVLCVVGPIIFFIVWEIFFASGDERDPLEPGPPRGSVVATISVGKGAGAIALGSGAVWVANGDDGTVSRIDPSSNKVVATIRVGRRPGGIAVDGSTAWVSNFEDATVSRIDTTTNTVTATLQVGTVPSDVALGEGAVWVGGLPLSRIDPRTNKVTRFQGVHVSSVATSPGAVWVARNEGAVVLRLDTSTGKTAASIPLEGIHSDLIVSHGSVWVTSPDGSASRLDAANGVVTATVSVGVSSRVVRSDDRAIWLDGYPVSRIDRSTNVVSKPLGEDGAAGLAIDHGALWVTLGDEVRRIDPGRLEP